MKNFVSIFNSNKRYGREEKKIKNLARKLSKLAGRKKLAFEVCLVSNRSIKDLNVRFRRKNKITNVLSFTGAGGSMRPDLGKHTRYLGEIFLAPDYIRSRNENLDRLFIHGFLHLLGYTHDMNRDRIKMEKVEEKLSKKLKI